MTTRTKPFVFCLVSSPLTDKDSIDVGRMHFKALFTPGHTVGHMIYLLDGRTIGAPSSLFSGDLVFLSGCGKSSSKISSVVSYFEAFSEQCTPIEKQVHSCSASVAVMHYVCFEFHPLCRACVYITW